MAQSRGPPASCAIDGLYAARVHDRGGPLRATAWSSGHKNDGRAARRAISYDQVMNFSWTPCSFAEVVFNWVIGELHSPEFRKLYTIRKPAIVDEILRGGSVSFGDLDDSQAAEIEDLFRLARGRLPAAYPLSGRWRYYRATASAAQLAQFRTMPIFSPLATVKALAEKLETDPSYRPRMQAAIKEIERRSRNGAALPGRPVAVVSSKAEQPTLIEGYKRSIVALRCAMPALPIYLCRLPQTVWAKFG